MRRQRLTVAAALAVPGLLTTATPVFAGEQTGQDAHTTSPSETLPQGTPDQVVFRLQVASLGPGYGWGRGVLHYKGQDYDIRVNGGGGPAIGYSNACAQGTVTNLGSVEQFDDTFWSVGTEATAGHGSSQMIFQNSRGAELHLSARTSGVRVSAETARYRFRVLGPSTKGGITAFRCS